MGPLHSPKEYLFNLYATSSGEAKRLWRQHIKEQWNNQCAYCGSEENLTIDHVIPKCRGGEDTWENLVVACGPCNTKKGNTPLEHTGMRLRRKPRPRLNKIQFALNNSNIQEWKLYSYE